MGTPRTQTDLEKQGLKGRVESVEDRRQRIVFNPQGYITANYVFPRGRGEVLTYTIAYAEDGVTPTERRDFSYYNESSTPRVDITTYNAEDVEKMRGPEEGCRYNEQGYIIRRDELPIDPLQKKIYCHRPMSVTNYIYDENNILTELHYERFVPRIVNGEADIKDIISYGVAKNRYTYNEQGDLSRMETTSEMGHEFVNSYEYEYDSVGNWIFKQAKGYDGNSRTITYYEQRGASLSLP